MAPFVRSWTLTSTTAQGYSERAVLSVGRPEHYRRNLTNGGFPVGTACRLDPATDAMVPARLVIKNITKGFYLKLDVHLTSSLVGGEVDYSRRPICAMGNSAGNNLSVQSDYPLPPGRVLTTFLYFIFTDYYSPAHPQGDTALLNAPLTIAGLAAGQPTQPTTEQLVGPGATRSVQTQEQWLLAVSGRQPNRYLTWPASSSDLP
ncbi:MAG TPA: hypothetical protein VHB02_03835 [Acidimicrobiales bacterium]|nr:hypothetical protein [Acidimicrobiales bacterium]